MKVVFSRHIFEKRSNIKFHENPVQRGPKCSMWTDRHDEANSRFFATLRTRLVHSAGSFLGKKNHSCYTVGINCCYSSIYCTQWGESNPRVHIVFNLIPAWNFPFPTNPPPPLQVVFIPYAFQPKFKNFLPPRLARHIPCPHTYNYSKFRN